MGVVCDVTVTPVIRATLGWKGALLEKELDTGSMRGGVFPASGLGRNINAIHGLLARSEVGSCDAAVERDRRKNHIRSAVGDRANGKHGVADGADAEVIARARTQGRSGERVGAGCIEILVSGLILIVREPVFVFRARASVPVAGRNGIAEVNDHITGLFTEVKVEAARHRSRSCEPVVAPITAREELVADGGAMHRNIGDVTG